MSEDYELFPGKNLSGLFEDIYNNQINKKRHISELIAEMRNAIRHAGDMAVIGPIIKDLIDTSVRNDDQLLKLATIAQRIMLSNNKGDGEAGFLSKEEREQLLQEIQEVEDEIKDSDKLDEIKSKIGSDAT